METKDIWSEWLKHRRFSGDASQQEQAMADYKKLAMEIINKSNISESDTVLDIGTGDGLVGLTALEKLGKNGNLILSDISEAALAIPKEIFKNNEDSRVTFLLAGAENLSALSDNSVDRIVLRSVLLYVGSKQIAFDEMFRILKKGGKTVILEPINQRSIEFQKNLFRGYKLDQEPLLKVKDLLKKISRLSKQDTPDTMIGYNEHDLVHFAVNAGFEDIKLEYYLTRNPQAQWGSWEFFFDTAPNPHARTLRELLIDILTKEEFIKVELALKEAVKQPTVRILPMALLILEK